eukprot:TRINITY_DN14538_c0_g1_i1.p1 TRINITY_DN14538_c0_g1~~TRINITY_DN14538_c0_g1_i1.p1  ORF type:complete len:218 (+),score=42.52 TRINITY_DN14538_c0_g1_i1:60-656(+)
MSGMCVETPVSGIGGITLEIPVIQVTASADENFIDFNREAHDLDSDWLMQPVAENDYDSETQYLVDTKEGKEASFSDHYVTKRKKYKKKGKAPEEDPAKLGVGVGKRSTVAPFMNGPTLKCDSLDVPGMSAPAKGVLSNPATRRIACGALPPELRMAPNETVSQPPPSYHDSVVKAATPPKTFASAKRSSPPTKDLTP